MGWCGAEHPSWLVYACRGATAASAVLFLLTCLILVAAFQRVHVLRHGKTSFGSNAASIPLIAALLAISGAGAVVLGVYGVPASQVFTQAAAAASLLLLLVGVALCLLLAGWDAAEQCSAHRAA